MGHLSREKFLVDELFYQKFFKNTTSQIVYHFEIFVFSILFQIVKQFNASGGHLSESHLTPTKPQYIDNIGNLYISKFFDTI